MKKNTFLQKIHRGFTLIELLIVIAVLGVLAAVVLVAIDPFEQLERSRDAGRKSQVGQLASAMQSYIVSQNLSTAPAASTTWEDLLAGGGEIKAALPAITNATCVPAANRQNGMCYAPGSGTDFFVWTNVESEAEIDKAEGPEVGTGSDADQTCPSTAPNPIYLYDSSTGTSGNTCAAGTGPTAGMTKYP
jgi:prepilin-type N-terminal cleavage/methylation domain-containing protein